MSTFVTTEKLSRLMDAVKAKIATKLDATGIKNDALTTDAGYVLDARMGKTLGDRTTSLETKVSDLYFATDSNGKWGYKATKNGAVTPFRNPTGDATAAEVLSGKTFSSATLENATGTMTNNGAWTGATTGEGNIAIPAGYHNGSGYVSGKTSYNDGYTKGYNTGYVAVTPDVLFSKLKSASMTGCTAGKYYLLIVGRNPSGDTGSAPNPTGCDICWSTNSVTGAGGGYWYVFLLRATGSTIASNVLGSAAGHTETFFEFA